MLDEVVTGADLGSVATGSAPEALRRAQWIDGLAVRRSQPSCCRRSWPGSARQAERLFDYDDMLELVWRAAPRRGELAARLRARLPWR
jgi:hypothetical protein